MAMLAWALGGSRRVLAGALCLLALAPIVFLSVAFPEGGSQPFVASAFWPAFAGVIAVGLLIPAEQRVLRIGALLYALVLLGSFLVPSAVGGNADRLGALAAGPIAACALFGSAQRWRRWGLIALVAPLTYWQANAPVADYVSTLSNPSTQASYYAPLLAELDRLGIGYGRRPARIEVVPTADHWEARYLAPEVMMARGWERQLDRDRNALFYSSASLTAASYGRWLRAQSVSYVALPRAPLDYSGEEEGELLSHPSVSRAGGPLREVWRSRYWRLFAVRRPAALAAPGTLTQVTAQSFTLRAPAPGRYVVRLRCTPYWSLADRAASRRPPEAGPSCSRARRARCTS
jgi:hypothetical protein